METYTYITTPDLFAQIVPLSTRVQLNKQWRRSGYSEYVNRYSRALFILPTSKEVREYIDQAECGIYLPCTYVMEWNNCGPANSQYDTLYFAKFSCKQRSISVDDSLDWEGMRVCDQEVDVCSGSVNPKEEIDLEKQHSMYGDWSIDATVYGTYRTTKRMLYSRLSQFHSPDRKLLYTRMTSWLRGVWSVEFLIERYRYTGHAVRYAMCELYCSSHISKRMTNKYTAEPSLSALGDLYRNVMDKRR